MPSTALTPPKWTATSRSSSTAAPGSPRAGGPCAWSTVMPSPSAATWTTRSRGCALGAPVAGPVISGSRSARAPSPPAAVPPLAAAPLDPSREIDEHTVDAAGQQTAATATMIPYSSVCHSPTKSSRLGSQVKMIAPMTAPFQDMAPPTMIIVSARTIGRSRCRAGRVVRADQDVHGAGQAAEQPG